MKYCDSNSILRANYLLNTYNVSRETLEKLEYFYFLFLKWSKKINLVSSSTVEDFWIRHVEDSLRVFQLHPYPSIWIDLGSGGGFPGIITSIQLSSIEGGLVNLIESKNKKASFLRYVVQKTAARGKVFACRIQEAPQMITTCDVISARALADLDTLLEYSFPWLSKKNNRKAFFYKGCNYALEISKARRRWDFSLIKHNSLVKNNSVILEISHVNRILES
ncbi:MAG: 16S rRNA (guanine(527)-N(7))-methyltransferase RsmG [Candidatus Liberibacter asiaticus]|uniref:Ribosomal RNA small subunit methyltransferase G n=1 Tax=Candidatus Liberibacter asiaticus str. gxpsy TaxID=1174529 RepID=A0ABN4B058_LIBAS|nr:16S rRNA (guanine(527)-N(7))-methyltransferase RsmG [Candidatus Liberibacter asiaticus]AGH16755.1 glucose-inhibited division protein B [Candidatus Liberibacter asiaticus str. gxpsy]BAP26275.1 glucose-inhibited division protein B [Candidatus Liberibacter asiaticus str. Ishi-1]ALK07125.1 16S rRNA (guanine(527)-N(7))-methyltransferase RsmG [Candidatus Liberibacter asiaticus]ASK52600.1 16S rRNA (guanine(527)-N(7))-methyltransferase RsmG [Candidatus Liberibacter asiaticus]AWL13925.1 16S rRNA (gu